MNTYHIIHAYQLCFFTHSTSRWNYYRRSPLSSVLAPTDVGCIIIINSLKTALDPLKRFRVFFVAALLLLPKLYIFARQSVIAPDQLLQQHNAIVGHFIPFFAAGTTSWF